MEPTNHLQETESVREQITPALGAIPAGIHILICDTDYMVVSWVQQAGFEPPTVSVALNKERPINVMIMEGKPFILNLIAEEDMKLCKPFFSNDTQAIKGLVETGGVIKGAMSYLKCRYQSRASSGDHEIVIAEVIGGKMLQDKKKPFIHIRKNGFQY